MMGVDRGTISRFKYVQMDMIAVISLAGRGPWPFICKSSPDHSPLLQGASRRLALADQFIRQH